MANLPLMGGVLLVAAYALMSHALMVYAADRPWAVAALFGPLLLAFAAVAIRRRHAPALLACIALVSLLVLVVSRGGVGDVNRLYVLQHAGIHLSLFAGFALTLRPGSTALISHLALRIHGEMPASQHAYTRRLTAVWAAYFAGMVLWSVGLYLFAPWAWWSLFANVLTPLSAATLFVVEHAMRRRWHPEFIPATLSQALRAYQNTGAANGGLR
jgi:uncharacterized membrane protein